MFILVHSPLVGPSTWQPVADELQRHGHAVQVPVLSEASPNEVNLPYWQQHALAVSPPARPPLLVGHSGAGLLLPAIRQALGQPPAGYIFVDSDLPRDAQSRLDGWRAGDANAAASIEAELRAGKKLPRWADEDLAPIVPDAEMRQQLLEELRPQPLAYWVEPIPVFAGWPDASCGYSHFSPAYDRAAAEARALGWHYAAMPGGHFHMLVDPPAVAAALASIAARFASQPGNGHASAA
jgi:hypothetical protein